jgi:hypothetical protein
MSKNNKLVGIVAALVLMLGGGAGATAYAATAKPAGTGVQSDGSVITCLNNKTHIYHSLVTGKKCVTGYTTITMSKTGKQGVQGPKGDKGSTGMTGPAAPELQYGIAKVYISRDGGTTRAPWATYSTTIGSPVGDTTGGTFRFTCKDAQAPCQISVGAFSTQTAGGVKIYPRLDVTRATLDNDSETNCEYADGTDNDGGTATLTGAESDNYPLSLGVGSTQSCGDQQASVPGASVTKISVPSGYYDVSSTFVFNK